MRNRTTTAVMTFLLAAGIWQFGGGLWIHLKAQLAQYLIAQAWQQTLIRGTPVKPWPWADTWPVAHLRGRDNLDLYVLAGINGASLPFGPGMERDADSGALILAGHRDTHFAFLRHVAPGDRLMLTDMQGRKTVYRIGIREVIDSRDTALLPYHHQAALLLVTCYPFDALRAGGPLRMVVSATPERMTGQPSRNRALRQATAMGF